MIDTQKILSRKTELNFSFRAMALAAGWGEEQGARIERVLSGDSADPRFTTAEGIADAIGLTLDELRANRPADSVNRGEVLEALRVATPDERLGLVTAARQIITRHRAANPTVPPPRRRPGRPAVVRDA